MHEIMLAFPKKRQAIHILAARHILHKLGIGEKDIAEATTPSGTVLLFYIRSRCRADFFVKRLRRTRLKSAAISATFLRKDDWQLKWKDYFKPFRFTKALTVVPLRMKDSYKGRGDVIYIDTGPVFGAGTHPTSQMIAAFIEKKKGLFKSFLDVGTGAGILSIVASRCGAQDIRAIDIDRRAIRTARRNCAINRCSLSHLGVLDFRRWRSKRQFDFVAANLLTDDLLTLDKKLASRVKKGGYLAVSGISLGNLPKFRRGFDIRSLRCLAVIKKKGWAALLYKKLDKK
ncbi:MAG: 50S ribosomal protein L11 methyltransferase [Candidatus Omnitrophica bacterium]|nr:50S ribosomal protein L11 methyltransferase [Candidatus Omnitrophota bacterium]